MSKQMEGSAVLKSAFSDLFKLQEWQEAFSRKEEFLNCFMQDGLFSDFILKKKLEVTTVNRIALAEHKHSTA